MAKVQKQANDAQLDSLREVHINWKGLILGWKKLTRDVPFSLHQKATRAIETKSRYLMTGSASLISMPIGLVLRNTSRAMNNSVEGKSFYSLAHVVGVLGSIGAIGLATMAAAPVIAAAVPAGVMSAVGGWAAYAVAGTVATTVLSMPAYTAATLIASTTLGTAVALFSATIAAPFNLPVAFRRSKASLDGIKLTDAQVTALEAEFDRESPTARYQRDLYRKTESNIFYLTDEQQKSIYLTLKDKFDAAAAAPAAAQPAAPAPTIAPKTP